MRVDGVANHVARRRDIFAQFLRHFLGQGNEIKSGLRAAIRCRHADAAAGADDRHAASLGSAGINKCRRDIRHFFQRTHPHRAALFENGVPYFFAAGHGAGVR